MQPKISSFFKSIAADACTGVGDGDSRGEAVAACYEEEEGVNKEDEVDVRKWGEAAGTGADILVTYKRRSLPSSPCSESVEVETDCIGARELTSSISAKSSARPGCPGKVLNKKRSYAQYHLELGQSDFLLHTCNICGLQYSRGDEDDEEVHKGFHKDYYQGIQFKGWRNEIVISNPGNNGERIILVSGDDHSSHKQKVQEVLKVMQKDLCTVDEWLLHKFCKVYLFVLKNRIIGCLVVEPIKAAHRITSNSISSKVSDGIIGSAAANICSGIDGHISTKSTRASPTLLQFGNVIFHREIIKRSSDSSKETQSDVGALFCEEEVVPAKCGIRAIWVAPSHRRQKIATRLLDSVRESFLNDSKLALCECAFSHPTSSGRAFAASYSRTQSFLVYKDADP